MDAANTELMNIELAEDRRRSLDCFDASFALFMDVNLFVIIFWYMLVVVVEVVLAVSLKETHERDTVPLRGSSVQTAAVAGRREEDSDRLEDTSPLLTEDS